jgi:hypothetical protein
MPYLHDPEADEAMDNGLNAFNAVLMRLFGAPSEWPRLRNVEGLEKGHIHWCCQRKGPLEDAIYRGHLEFEMVSRRGSRSESVD